MHVLECRIVIERANVSAPADHADFAIKLYERFKHAHRRSEPRPRFIRLPERLDLHLALAVVPELRGLQHAGCAEFLDRASQFFDARDLSERRDRETMTGQKFLLSQPMTRRLQH